MRKALKLQFDILIHGRKLQNWSTATSYKHLITSSFLGTDRERGQYNCSCRHKSTNCRSHSGKIGRFPFCIYVPDHVLVRFRLSQFKASLSPIAWLLCNMCKWKNRRLFTEPFPQWYRFLRYKTVFLFLLIFFWLMCSWYIYTSYKYFTMTEVLPCCLSILIFNKRTTRIRTNCYY